MYGRENHVSRSTCSAMLVNVAVYGNMFYSVSSESAAARAYSHLLFMLDFAVGPIITAAGLEALNTTQLFAPKDL